MKMQYLKYHLMVIAFIAVIAYLLISISQYKPEQQAPNKVPNPVEITYNQVRLTKFDQKVRLDQKIANFVQRLRILANFWQIFGEFWRTLANF